MSEPGWKDKTPEEILADLNEIIRRQIAECASGPPSIDGPWIDHNVEVNAPPPPPPDENA